MRKNFYALTLGAALVFSTACSESTRERNRTEADRAADRTATATDRAADRTAAATDRAADRTGAAAHRAGDTLDNAGLTTKVKSKLAADVRLSTLTSVNVDSNDGVVTLTGHVPTAADKRQAEVVVKQTDGVRRVINHLTIKP